LACDDDQIEAHKVILSACSPVLGQILKRNPHPHPLVFMKGVGCKELISVLDFMYLGEVNVAQDDLSSFLALAQDLEIKGLTQNKTTEEVENGNSHEHFELGEPPPFKKRKRSKPKSILEHSMNSSSSQNHSQAGSDETICISKSNLYALKTEESVRDVHSIHEVAPNPVDTLDPLTPKIEVCDYELDQEESSIPSIPVTEVQSPSVVDGKVKMKSSSKLYNSWTIHHHPENNFMKDSDENSLQYTPNESLDSSNCFADQSEDWDALAASKMAKADNMWQCLECSYLSRNKTSVISHVQGKHMESFRGYICKICGGNSGTYCGFEKHMLRQHKYSIARHVRLEEV